MHLRLREAQIEAAQQRGDRCGRETPATQRSLRHAPIDQDERHGVVRGSNHQVWPQIRFDKKCEIGLPVREKSADETRRVQHGELMNDA